MVNLHNELSCTLTIFPFVEIPIVPAVAGVSRRVFNPLTYLLGNSRRELPNLVMTQASWHRQAPMFGGSGMELRISISITGGVMKRCLFSLSAVALLGFANVAWSDSAGLAQSPWQAYPPSCLAYPLPEPSGPTWSVPLELETNGTTDHHESVNVVFWRTSCGAKKSALLGKVFRDASSVNKFPQPLFEGVRISQGAVQEHPARLATEPNTVLSFVPFELAVSDSIEFVFENDASASFDYSQALTLTMTATENSRTVSIPAYDEMQYPTADLSLQLSGYLTGNFFDPAHGGEGAQVEIGAGAGNSRYIIFAWYTYTSAGLPFWLFGQGAFNSGDRSANVTVAYATGGGFAGGPSATNTNWGALTVEFPGCNSMHFSYQANSGLPAGIPQGSGSRTWTRLTSISGLTCE